MRQLLAKDYEQCFGASDEAIRNALGIRGKVADFVGYNARKSVPRRRGTAVKAHTPRKA